MIILLGVLAVIVLLLLIRIRFRVDYDKDGLRASLRILFFKIKFPRDKVKKKPEKKEKTKREKGAPMSELKDVISIGFKMLGKAFKTIRIENLYADVTIASDDAFKTAMLYGSAAAGCGIIIPPLENNFNIKKKEINVNADFESTETTVCFNARASIAIWQILKLGFIFIWRYINLKNQKEGN